MSIDQFKCTSSRRDNHGTADLTRRSILSAAIVSPMVPVATMAAASSQDPVPQLVDLWHTCTHALSARIEAEGSCETPAARDLEREQWRLEDLIEQSVAPTHEGIRAQMDYLIEAYGDPLGDDPYEVPTRLIASIRAALA